MSKFKIFHLILGVILTTGLSISGALLLQPKNIIDENLGSRTSNSWLVRNGSYLEVTKPSGYDVLIKGTNKYLNFNTTVGSSGYGFRDNGGVMEFKSSGGSWVQFATSTLSLSALSATAPLVYTTATATAVFSITQSGVGTDGYLDSTDWNTFNNKWDGLSDMALATGNVYVGDGSNNPTATSSIYIDSNGNVGISSTTPQEKLSVEGNVYIDGIGTSTEWNVTGKKLTVDGDRIYHGVGFLTDGMSEDKQDISLRTSAGDVYLDVEKTGGGDVEYIFDQIEYDLDCTTGGGAGGKATVQLTEGTATAPVRNYIYAVKSGSTAILNASTTLPDGSGGFVWVGIAVIQSDTEVDSDGGLLFQRTNEALKHDGRGKVSEMAEKLRFLGPEYLNGVDQTLTISASSTARDPVVLTTNTGQVYQLHRNDWSAYDVSTDGIFVANAGGAGALTKYQKITDLNQAFEITDGTTIANNNRYILTIWCAMNSASQQKCFVNLPTGTYTSDENALADVSNKAVTTIPAEFKTTGFLLAKVVLKYTSASNGTITNLSGGTAVQDLRGLAVGFNLGGAGGSDQTSFADNIFSIFDNGDATRIIAFEASGISAGTTRTLTVQDGNGTLAYINNQTFTGTTVTTNLTVSATTTFNGIAYKFPATDGSNGQLLTTNGAGQLTWTAAGAGDVTDVYDCASGDCNQMTMGAGEYLDASSGRLTAPNGASGYTNNTGDMFIDTTSGQLRYGNGSGTTTLSGTMTSCYPFASSTAIVSGLIRGVGSKGVGITVVSHNAKVGDGTTLVINLSDGTADMNSITASTTRNNIAVSSNTTWNAYEDIEVQFGTNTGGVTNGDYCINYRITED